MSQDLFAAFGPPASESSKENVRQASEPRHSFFGEINAPVLSTSVASKPTVAQNQPHNDAQTATPFQVELNEDEWGDFEGEGGVPKPSVAVPIASQFSRWLDEEDDGFRDYEMPTRPPGTKWDFTKPDPPASKSRDKPIPEVPSERSALPPKPISRSAVIQPVRDPNVLFDVEDEHYDVEDDDEFGEFEGASADTPQASIVDNFDLLGMDSPPRPVAQKTSASYIAQAPPTSTSLLDFDDMILEETPSNVPIVQVQTPQNPVVQSKHAFASLGSLSKADSDAKESIHEASSSSFNQLNPRTTEDVPSTGAEEQWDEFEAWEDAGTISEAQPTLPIPPPLISQSHDSTIKSPPTNIPPPALVLSLFSPIFSSAESSFFQPLRQESTEVRRAIYNDPATLMYLKGLLALATVCGRVIAGRKHRWKRDNILAQSMRIGPSGAGGISGLKLTSIDKAETAKEDREATDAVKAFQAQVGKLKSAIAELKRVNGKEAGKTPELRDPIPVRIAKEIEGGLRGNKSCALCGLKREERVSKVDFEVDDSFGEWWVEDVSMHRACRNFWEQHRESLKQR